MSGGAGVLGEFAAALLDPEHPLPAGLLTRHGADLETRFAVYRNNVVVSLVAALADTFPVTRELVGEQFFDAMARCFIVAQPPRSPVLTEYGDDFPDFVASFGPARALAYLPDVARLEVARVRAYHAAEAEGLGTAGLAALLADPRRLPGVQLRLHPSFVVVAAGHAVVSLWAAHHGEGRLDSVDPARPESALVLRDGNDVLVLRVSVGTGAFLAKLKEGSPLGEAASVAAAREPGFDLARVLALLIHHGGIAACHLPGDLDS
jgi:hypothetical protein